ncbi:MAG: FHA domain-containing protein, partial [Pseudobdellovibrionaceae bacterium]
MKSPLILRLFKNGQLFEVKQFDFDQITIGHNAEVSLDLNDDLVSPIHAMIELRDQHYYVCD